MNDYELRKLLKKLHIMMRCPNCGKSYHLEEISIRGYLDQTYFLNMDCSNCHIPVFATVAISGDTSGISDTKPENQLENLNQPNNLLEKSQPLIQNDDILEMHKFLEDFDGDFSRNFGLDWKNSA